MFLSPLHIIGSVSHLLQPPGVEIRFPAWTGVSMEGQQTNWAAWEMPSDKERAWIMQELTLEAWLTGTVITSEALECSGKAPVSPKPTVGDPRGKDGAVGKEGIFFLSGSVDSIPLCYAGVGESFLSLSPKTGHGKCLELPGGCRATLQVLPLPCPW